MRHFISNIARSCYSHDLLTLSSSIAFYAILSLLPMIMIIFAVLGHIIGDEAEIVTQIADALTEMIPGARDLFISNMRNLVSQKTAIGWWGFGFLLLISTVLFSSLEKAFGRIFESEKKRHFFHSRLLAIVVISLILMLLFLPSVVRLLESILIKYGYFIPLSSYLSGKIFFVIFAILSFVVMVIIVPNQKVFLRYALVGGVFYTFGIGLAKYLFHWYIAMTLDRYNLIYGSLTAMILMVVWIYYLAIVLLISAEVVAYLQVKRGVG